MRDVRWDGVGVCSSDVDEDWAIVAALPLLPAERGIR